LSNASLPSRAKRRFLFERRDEFCMRAEWPDAAALPVLFHALGDASINGLSL
jgi:hypothetical protein